MCSISEKQMANALFRFYVIIATYNNIFKSTVICMGTRGYSLTQYLLTSMVTFDFL